MSYTCTQILSPPSQRVPHHRGHFFIGFIVRFADHDLSLTRAPITFLEVPVLLFARAASKVKKLTGDVIIALGFTDLGNSSPVAVFGQQCILLAGTRLELARCQASSPRTHVGDHVGDPRWALWKVVAFCAAASTLAEATAGDIAKEEGAESQDRRTNASRYRSRWVLPRSLRAHDIRGSTRYGR